MNQLIIVGKVIAVNKDKPSITLSVKRRISDDIREDLIPVRLDNGLNVSLEYLEVGVVVGVKARLESVNDLLVVVAEKITFINKGGSNGE
jgi:hypothetical protein